ncbi:hypothetical protein ACFL1C_08435, partial [Pseudomonadota bacterium]
AVDFLLYLQQFQFNEARALYGDPGPVSINGRLNAAMMGTFRSTYGPTETHSRSFEIAEQKFNEVAGGIRQIIDVRMPALRKELDRAGVPWTPGRGVPNKD